MTTWFTADHHFGHANVIRMCDRPFRDVRDMEHEMIAQWNAAVRPGDTVWHLGDFAYRCDERVVRKVFEALNGTKHLIPGNHDDAKVRNLKWASVELYKDLAVDGSRVFLCHYGMRVWPGLHRGAVHLYGHSHGRLAGYRNCLDVGVDSWDFRPVSLPEIRARLDTLPEYDAERDEPSSPFEP